MTPEDKLVVDARLRELRTQLDVDLQPACDALFARRHLLGDDITPYVNPLAQPVFTIVNWAQDVAALPQSTVVDLMESSILGYLVVRIHDDWMDEGLGDPSNNLLLANRFAVRHQRRIAETVGGSREYWDLHEHVWANYGNAMAFEQRCLAPPHAYTDSDFERVLDRSQPLVLPLAAALVVGGRLDLLPVAGQLVRHTTMAAQLFNDVRDATDDVARGQHTWVARQLGSLKGAGEVRVKLMRGGLTTMLEKARQEMKMAEILAMAHGLNRAAQFCRDRIVALSIWQEKVFRSLFTQLLRP